MEAQVIDTLRHKYSLKQLFRYFSMARSTFYYNLKRAKQPDKYQQVKSEIKSIFSKNLETFGYIRIWLELVKCGISICPETVRKLMTQLGIKTKVYSKPTSKRYSSFRGKVGKIAPNLLKQHFSEKIPFKMLHTDIIQVQLVDGKKAYISAIIDEASSEVISLVADNNERFQLVERMLNETKIKIKDLKQVTIHSDQGFHYQIPAYQRWIKANHVTQSMSRKGNCLDNAPIESFFNLLKRECLNRIKLTSLTSLKKVCQEYIKWFNEERISGNKKGLTPIEYRNKSLKTE
ncbi:IS3 family transposase [Fructilactobacillus cliffordii]|uniref:IS3 family transposase n=1 Tax=Fructilactobacillus cliffordii TaxID=2940299 RepID=A0A9Q8ZSR5_9LACO|nr:IS3 family transposase [Fructilactobacillus cliffordii]USS88964.1 IS3 family transposase [Fructilactobacillus cliffordii]